jgi:RNA polymerase sigma factor (sigma-70 family)
MRLVGPSWDERGAMKETRHSPESSDPDEFDRTLVNLISAGVQAERALEERKQPKKMIAPRRSDGAEAKQALADHGENGDAVTSSASGGVEAGARTGEVPDAEQSALEKQRDAGQQAAAALFQRYQHVIEAFARSRGLRSELVPGDSRRDLPSVEEFMNEVYVRVFWSTRVGTWRGKRFCGWLRTVLKNVWVDMIRERSREKPREEGPLEDQQLAAVHGPGEDEPDAFATLNTIVDAMPPDRRLVYRLSYTLPLTEADLDWLQTRRAGGDREAVRQQVARLYESVRERADAKWSKIARARSKCGSKVRDVRARLGALQRRVSRTAAQEQELGDLRQQLQQLQDELGKLDAQFKKIRVPSRRVAEILGTTPNNVDQHLRRARRDVASATAAMKEDIR